MKVLISDFPAALAPDSEIQKKNLHSQFPDWQIEIWPYNGNQNELTDHVRDADAVLTAFMPMNAEVISAMKPGACISVAATGYDSIDDAAAEEHKVALMAIREYCTEEVAEHTIALLLGLCRHLKDTDADPAAYQTLKGKKIGIFGYGRIGQRVGQLAEAFRMEVYVSAFGRVSSYINRVVADADTVLKECDVITCHMPETPENHHYFNFSRFQEMKKKPIFLNCGRGGLVDTDALVKALEEGWISGAGIDVIEDEHEGSASSQKLSSFTNVLVTPHKAYASEASCKALQDIPVDNIVAYLTHKYGKINAFVKGPYHD